ncbi:MAG: class I SAM-dependent methyltransferase [Actinomycetota bacterium]
MTQSPSDPSPLERWRRALAEWAIPDEILTQAPEPPWSFPTKVFSQRAERQLAERSGTSLRRAAEALPEGGSVLDVGAGGGAASLPLLRPARGPSGSIVAVDAEPRMLEDFLERAGRLGVAARAVPGRWPDVAPEVPAADVVVCHHVLYNVPDLEPFVSALTDRARRRIVVELTERHPVSPLNPLWRRFWGLERPERPTAADAVAALRSLGLDVTVETWNAPVDDGDPAEAAALARRRLCLPLDQEPDVARALEELRESGDAGWGQPRRLVTVWWAGAA